MDLPNFSMLVTVLSVDDEDLFGLSLDVGVAVADLADIENKRVLDPPFSVASALAARAILVFGEAQARDYWERD